MNKAIGKIFVGGALLTLLTSGLAYAGTQKKTQVKYLGNRTQGAKLVFAGEATNSTYNDRRYDGFQAHIRLFGGTYQLLDMGDDFQISLKRPLLPVN